MRYIGNMKRIYASKPSALSQVLGKAFADAALEAAARAEMAGVKPAGIARPPERAGAKSTPPVPFAAPRAKPRKRAKA